MLEASKCVTSFGEVSEYGIDHFQPTVGVIFVAPRNFGLCHALTNV